MEKIVYVVWKPADTPIQQFREQLLGPVGRTLAAHGAHKIAVNLCDEHAAFAEGRRISRMDEPFAGTVSVWMDTHLNRHAAEEALSRACARVAGYLVLESVPLAKIPQTVAPGERMRGICFVAFLEKPDFLTYDAWLDLWQGHHTQVAIETQSTFLYIQNVVVRPLTPDAPPWTAIVEEAFPAEAATDPMVFFNAGGAKEKLKEHQRRMFDSVQKFIDLSRLESHPMSSYVVTTT